MTTESFPTFIRVADAPPVTVTGAKRKGSQPGAPVSPIRTLFFVVLLVHTVFCFSEALFTTRGQLNLLIVYIRYMLWSMIVLGLALHILRAGWSHYLRTIAIVLPFLGIGIIAGLNGVDPIYSARVIMFWILGVTSAIVIGSELPPRTVRTVLIWSLFALLAASVVLVLVLPGFAIMRDLRTGDIGAWRGLFTGKNALGAMSAYAIVIAIASRDVAWKTRIPALVTGTVCILFANSGGAILLVVLGVAFVVAINLLRTTNLSSIAQASILFFFLSFAIVLAYAAYLPVLELLGRDPSLTGRTDVWAAYFRRALDHWVLGTGPGSFMTRSIATADVGAMFQIDTPHSMYIAAFGEVGIFGLFAFTGALLYLGFIVPFRHGGTMALQTAAMAFFMIVAGLGETHEVFGAGFGMFLTILMYSGMIRGLGDRPASSEQHQTLDRGQLDVPRLS